MFQSVSLLILGSLPPFCSNLQDTNAVLESLLHNRNLHHLGDKHFSQFHSPYIYSSLVFLLTPNGFWSGVHCFVYNTFQVQEFLGAHWEKIWRFEQRTFYVGLSMAPRGQKLSLGLNEPKYAALCSNSTTTSKHSPQKGNFFSCAKQPINNHPGPTLNKKTH